VVRPSHLAVTAREHGPHRVTGLDEGADDYLVKPFDFSELLARVRASSDEERHAVDRHHGGRPGPRLHHPRGQHRLRPASADGDGARLLEILMQRSPAIVSRRSIALAVWNEEARRPGLEHLDVTWPVAGQDRHRGAKIESVRALGYRLVPA